MARSRVHPAAPLDSVAVGRTSIGLRPVEHLALKVLAKRKRTSASELIRDHVRGDMQRLFGEDWIQNIEGIANREGVAA